MVSAMNELILGGARSGKSRFAEKRALDCGLAVTYIATATAGDNEMKTRIHRHRAERPAAWETQEVPLYLASALATFAAENHCLLVDCLTLWLSNLLGFAHDRGVSLDNPEQTFQHEREALLDTLPSLPGKIIFVSNEIGQGLVPADPLTRRFRDEAGWLHQAIAERCEQVFWVVAGLPQQLKGTAVE